MEPHNKIVRFLSPMVLVFLLSSCSTYQEPADDTPFPDVDQIRKRDSLVRRFKDPGEQGMAGGDSAVELSKKYAELSEEAATLRLKNQDLVAESRRLKDQVDVLGAELQQTQEELTQANSLLREMVIELNNWKMNVIGFREEMRDAEKTQLEALLKILKALGGEVKEEWVEGEKTGPAAVSTSEPVRSPFKEATSAGEPNE